MPSLRAEAGSARQGCSEGELQACLQLARIYAREHAQERVLLAAHILKPFCDGGDGETCMEIASLHPRAPPQKIEIYAQACENGSRAGCLWQTRLDPSLAPAERLSPLQDACVEGSVFACRMQAELLYTEAGRFETKRKDRERARALFLFACDGGDIEACFQRGNHLAEVARRSTSSDEVLDEAREYLDRACALDHAQACFSLGNIYSYVTSPSGTSLELAIHYYGSACRLSVGARYCGQFASVTLAQERNRLRADYGVLASALMAHEQDFRDDYRARVRRYRRDCSEGDMEQCVALGDRYQDRLEVDGIYGLKETTPTDWAWARTLYEHACDQDFALGCERVADSYHHAVDHGDPAQAIVSSRKACALGSDSGCFRVAEFLAKGEGVEADLIAAEAHYRRACQLGMDFACHQLASIEMWEGDPATRDERFLLACLHGGWFACGSLRDAVRELGDREHHQRLAQEFSSIACDEGDEEVCLVLRRTPKD